MAAEVACVLTAEVAIADCSSWTRFSCIVDNMSGEVRFDSCTNRLFGPHSDGTSSKDTSFSTSPVFRLFSQQMVTEWIKACSEEPAGRPDIHKLHGANPSVGRCRRSRSTNWWPCRSWVNSSPGACGVWAEHSSSSGHTVPLAWSIGFCIVLLVYTTLCSASRSLSSVRRIQKLETRCTC